MNALFQETNNCLTHIIIIIIIILIIIIIIIIIPVVSLAYSKN